MYVNIGNNTSNLFSLPPFPLQYIFYTDHMEKIKLDHVTQVIGYHPKYLEHFLRTQNFIMYGDGPLPYNYRHYLAIMVSFTLLTLTKYQIFNPILHPFHPSPT